MTAINTRSGIPVVPAPSSRSIEPGVSPAPQPQPDIASPVSNPPAVQPRETLGWVRRARTGPLPDFTTTQHVSSFVATPSRKTLDQLLNEVSKRTPVVAAQVAPLATPAAVPTQTKTEPPQTPLNTDRGVPTASAQRSFDLAAELSSPDSALSIAIGKAEGTRDVSGGRTAAYRSHIDPGNGARNAGTFSYQVRQGGASSPAQADQVQLGRFRAVRPQYEAAARNAGLDPKDPLLAAAFFDSWNQSPAMATGRNGFLDQLPRIAREGVSLESLTNARVRSWYEPSGRLNAPGLGNTEAGVRADQSRRMNAIADVLRPRGLLGNASATSDLSNSSQAPSTPAPLAEADRSSSTRPQLEASTPSTPSTPSAPSRLEEVLAQVARPPVDGAGAKPVQQPAESARPPSGTDRPTNNTINASEKGQGVVTAGNFTVDANNRSLKALATGKLVKAGEGLCVTGTLINMQNNGVRQPAATGMDVGNNPRGGMVQLVRDFGWKSLPLDGAREQTIKSPYGTIKANVIPAADYKRLALEGKIPSGAVVFQTRHDSWNATSVKSRGFDMGIARNGGRTLFNYADMGGPMVYGDNTRHVVVLVPGDSLRAN